MPKFGIPSAEVVWSNQKLDEIDAALASLGSSVERLTGNTRVWAERAVRRLQAARDLELEIQACCFDTTTQVAPVTERDPLPHAGAAQVNRTQPADANPMALATVGPESAASANRMLRC